VVALIKKAIAEEAQDTASRLALTPGNTNTSGTQPATVMSCAEAGGEQRLRGQVDGGQSDAKRVPESSSGSSDPLFQDVDSELELDGSLPPARLAAVLRDPVSGKPLSPE